MPLAVKAILADPKEDEVADPEAMVRNDHLDPTEIKFKINANLRLRIKIATKSNQASCVELRPSPGQCAPAHPRIGTRNS